MRFYNLQECEQWLRSADRKFPDAQSSSGTERLAYPTEPHGMFYNARWIAKSLIFDSDALLWITEWGIWPSSENWHLYYKLRQGYGDNNLLHESPGHLFLGHETEDLTSFLQLAMLNGWGGYLLTQANYVNLFFSHDEYIDFHGNGYDLGEIRSALGPKKQDTP